MPAPKITFELLREIAETASGLRNEQLYFLVRGDPATFSWQDTPPAPSPDVVVIPCSPTTDPRPRVKVAELGGLQGKPVDLLHVTVHPQGAYPGGVYEADAAFWSLSAVEKFMVPYYASVFGDQGPEHAAAVLDILMHPLQAAGGEVPFAVAHLPSSEYVPVESEAMFVPRAAALSSRGAHPIPVRKR